MRFQQFEALAREIFEEIPEVYLQGIDGLTVRREAPEHPDHPGVYTLGECLTEEHVSDYGSSETTRSVIALYWGSFRALAQQSEDFDWEEETWETLTHELRHHLESLAGDAALEGVDHAADQSFKRFDDQPFDPWYYQYGDEVEDGVYRVERSWYVEVTRSAQRVGEDDWVDFRWRGGAYRVPAPDEGADVHFVYLHGLEDVEEGHTVELVIVRERSWWENLKRLVRAAPPVTAEWEADVQRMEPAGGEAAAERGGGVGPGREGGPGSGGRKGNDA